MASHHYSPSEEEISPIYSVENVGRWSHFYFAVGIFQQLRFTKVAGGYNVCDETYIVDFINELLEFLWASPFVKGLWSNPIHCKDIFFAKHANETYIDCVFSYSMLGMKEEVDIFYKNSRFSKWLLISENGPLILRSKYLLYPMKYHKCCRIDSTCVRRNPFIE